MFGIAKFEAKLRHGVWHAKVTIAAEDGRVIVKHITAEDHDTLVNLAVKLAETYCPVWAKVGTAPKPG